MSLSMTASPDSASDPLQPAPAPATRPLYWSIRRELWENRLVYIAPLIITACVLAGVLFKLLGLPDRMAAAGALDRVAQHLTVIRPFHLAPAPIMLATFVIGMFYAADALSGERRDRSLLFWKSLPVSDATAVISKAAVPLVVLPLIALVLSIVTVTVLLLAASLVLAGSGVSPWRLWSEVALLELPVIMTYGLAVHALWLAPVYAWLMFVSAWARRMPILWATLPLFAIAALERVGFGSTIFLAFIGGRFTGAMSAGFAQSRGQSELIEHVTQLEPLRFLTSPGMWGGLAAALLLLWAAMRLRRRHEPT